MHPVLVLLHLAAAVMLLLWAVRMVRTGVERGHGAALRSAMRRARGGRVGMAAMGAVLAVLLQSATAVGVLATGFASTGIMSVGQGMAALLGADLGSALVVKLLSFDLSGLIPLLILAGATMFLKFENRQVRQAGRVVLGIGFVLLSLRMVGEATAPLRDSTALPAIAGYLAGDPITAFLAAALLAWGLHSSVAMVLLLATFAGAGVLPVAAALPMVLGANVGAGLVGVWLTRASVLPARRIPLGNLMFRVISALALLGGMQLVGLPHAALGGSASAQVVNFHLLYNAGLVVLALPFVGLMDRATARLWPEPAQQGVEPFRSALDRGSLGTPTLALASARRELLRMGETLERMLRPVMDLIDLGDRPQIDALRAIDAEVNRRQTDIKLFVAEVNRGALTEDEVRRGLELTALALDFEQIGDLIARNLLMLAEEKAARGLRFSAEGWAEMNTMHARVLANLQIALNVLVSGDLESARHLVAEKAILRRLERDSHNRHLARLQSGQRDSIDTSDIHLEVMRTLKEVNSLLVKVAYPILHEQGHLLESRLRLPEFG